MNLDSLRFHPPKLLVLRMKLLMLAGVITLALGMAVAPRRVWANLLLLSFYFVGLCLGGLVLIAIQYASSAHWGIALRRVPEAMGRLLPVGGLGVLTVVLAYPQLYSWTQPAGKVAEAEPVFRHWWLSLPFFRGRAVVFLLVWLLFAWGLLRNSLLQDRNGDAALTRRNGRLSALFLVVFAVTFWLASYDWVMSLEPEWSSTIFGAYNFAGMFLSALAVTTIVVVWLQSRSPLSEVIRRDHLHDLGKLLFAFSTFWMYLWFSQYMLIWYANIPEETGYFVERQHGYWAPLMVLNLFLNWVIPFLVLLPRGNKQSPGVLVRISVVLLLGRWLDLYLMILPPFSAAAPAIGPIEIGLAAGAAGLFGYGLFAALKQAPLVPARDPHLEESLHYHA